jgi:hypothetical protein
LVPSASVPLLHHPDVQTVTMIAVGVEDLTPATVVDPLTRRLDLEAVIAVVAPAGTASAVNSEFNRQHVLR